MAIEKVKRMHKCFPNHLLMETLKKEILSSKGDLTLLSLQVTHNASPVTPIDHWWYCAEWVWWSGYIWSDIWFYVDHWEASSLGLQSSFSKALYLEEVLALFHDRLLIRRCFWGFVLPVLEYCSAVWCSAADTHLKLLDQVVSGACFLAGGVLNCNLSHRWSVAVLYMLYKIRCNCNPKHPLCGALPLPMCQSGLHAVVWSHIGILMHLAAAEPRSTAGLLFPSHYLWNNLVDPVFDGVWLAGFKSRSNAFFVGIVALSFLVFNYFPFLFVSSIGS